MADVEFYKIDETTTGIRGNRNAILELRDTYSFYAQNYKYDKRYKAGYWDGKISLINMKDGTVPSGIIPRLCEYMSANKITYSEFKNQYDDMLFSEDEVYNFYKAINGPFRPHESQVIAFQKCVEEERNIILAPTSNGKSYIIHGLNCYYTRQRKKVLILIDRSQLVLQLKSNFVDEYGADQFYTTSTIYEDQDSDVTISTWQSLLNKPDSFLKKFDVLIGDEVHAWKAKSLLEIAKKCGHIHYRHGFTATLDNDSKSDALTIEGVFGRPFQTTTLQEQIEGGISARPIIYVVYIKYSAQDKKNLKEQVNLAKRVAIQEGRKNMDTLRFIEESKFLETHYERNQMIRKIAGSQIGNTLIAFKNAEHGKTIFETIKGLDENIFFVNGSIGKIKRFEIQKKIETLKSSIAVVSFGTFSKGINIPNLNNLIIASQVKSGITVPQLIGRMVRLTTDKKSANVIDICDDLSSSNDKNIFLSHFEERLKFYLKSGFEIKTKIIKF